MNPASDAYRAEVLRGYLIAAVWADGCDPDDGEHADADPYTLAVDILDAFAAETLAAASELVADLCDRHGSILAGYRPDEVGHDLWLTRQRHGAGYWDGGYREDHGETLTAYAQALGEATCYVPADGLAWIE